MADSADRERPFNAAMVRGLGESRAPGGQGCPDLEALAAYFERSLSRGERERVELHAARCARCQGVLAAIAASEAASIEPGASIGAWRWRWIAAGAGLSAALVALLLVIPLRPSQPQIAMEAHELAPRNEAQQMASITSGGAKPEAAPGGVINAPAKALAALAPQPPRNFAKLGKETGQSQQMEPLRYKAIAPRAISELPWVETAPPPQVASREAIAESATAARSVTESAPAAAGALVGGVGAASAYALRGSIVPPTAPAVVFFESADKSVLWRLGRGGAIARRNEQGLWQPQRSGVSVDLIAGSAPSANVCWMVGRAGVIIRTLDGGNWQQVSSPTRSDITGVTAQSALAVTITIGGAGRFVTSDGGASWSPAAP